ncbi:MAG: hypothetical protein PHY29_11700 [Syntrophales bacterium]|nr:hypothetical protein [Syntrophales bacterium]
MSDFDFLRLIKWVFIVLVAGFIGQFGKTLAKQKRATALKKQADG